MENNKQKKQTAQQDDMRYIRFWGGRKLIFTLVVLIMLGILLMISNQVSFIFRPLQVIFSTIVAPVILAIVFFYLLNPAVTWLEKKKVKRLYGTILVFVLFIFLVVYGVTLLIPVIIDQITGFVNDFPGYIDTLSSRVEEFVAGTFFESYYHDAMGNLNEWVGEVPSIIWTWVMNSSQRIVEVFSTISNVVIVILTFPIILFFMLVERGKFKPFIMTLLPPVFREDVSIVSERMTKTVGSYIVGELLVALSLGALLLAGYLIIGLDYAFVLAIIATFTAIIPFIGATIGILPALIVAAFTSPGMLLKMGIVWLAGQFIQGNFIEPNIMGRSLKMHPLTIIVVLLIAGDMLGIVGMILGVPMFAILKVLMEYFFEKFKKRYNRFYAGAAGPYEIDQEIAGDTVTVDIDGNIKD